MKAARKSFGLEFGSLEESVRVGRTHFYGQPCVKLLKSTEISK